VASSLRFAVHNFLTTEHVDIAADYVGGTWQLDVEDDDAILEHDAGRAIEYARPTPRLSRPSARRDFLGVAAGQDVWVQAATQNPNILYLGFSAENTNGGTFASYPETDPREQYRRVDEAEPEGSPRAGAFSVYQTDAFAA
jgi:hypothetical protein